MTQIVNAGFTQAFNMFPSGCVLVGLIQGAGAAAPVVAPTTFSATSSKGFMSQLNNFVSTVAGDIVRSGVGVYTVKFRASLPVNFDITANVWGPNGTWSSIVDFNPTTGILSFKTFAAAGAAADLAATEFVHFTVIGQLTSYQ
jgi:hypothetical protein